MQTHAAPKESASHANKPFFGAQSTRSTNFFTSLPVTQAKLTMGESGDRFEREADAVADAVVQRKGLPGTGGSGAPSVQAKCAKCEHEDTVQRQADGSTSDTGAHSADSVQQGLAAQRGAGQSLDASVRQEMEQGIGADFSGVRIHTGAQAASLNDSLHARAFTHGQDVFFNSGEFEPGSSAGRHLLAHELTHVVQQSGSQGPQIQRACGAAAIGAPAGCTTNLPVFLSGYPTFRFNANCDTFAAGQEAALVAHASGLPATASFEVHGYSSAAGDPAFNRNLSCARAQEARRALTDPLPGGAGIPAARIASVFAHGGTPGSPTSARSSVVLTPPRATPLPAAVPVPGATDFAINRIGASSTSRIFFAAGSAALTADANSQISTLKAMAPGTVRVIGFVSAGEADALAQSRANAVKAKLVAAPTPVTVSSAVGIPGTMKATSDLVEARSVEIVIGGAAPTKLNCSATDPITGALINPATQSCATMDPATDTAFNTAHPIAKDAMTRAVAAVAGAPDAVATPLIDRFFGNHSAATLAKLRTNLARLQTKVNALPGITQCGGQCDTGGCDEGPIAYHTEASVVPPKMVLCVPTFRSLTANDQPRNLIHETAHGTSPLGGGPGRGTKDLAYRHERMLFHLSPADRLRNSDNYALFAMFIREARITGIATAVPGGISTPSSDSMPGISALEKPALEFALASLEKRLTSSEDWMGQLYGQVHSVRTGAFAWAASWAEDLMTEAAKRFPLTAPAVGPPSVTDQIRVAGILDRYRRMKAAVKRNLTVTKAATGVVSWPASIALIPGASLSVGPDFFRAARDDQAPLLLEGLARATSAVEPAFVPAYVTLAEWIHSKHS
jgi:outer membrane protein OmpA-like peptidoglycan-associated protein